MIRAITLAAAGLILSAVIPIARSSITGVLPALIAVASYAALTFTEADTLWVILGAACLGVAGLSLA